MLLIVVAIILVNWLCARGSAGWRVTAWLATMILLVAFMALVGHLLKRTWCGVIIDNRNRVSLSKLQAAAWSAVVLSAVVTATSVNLAWAGFGTAIDVNIPPHLLIAMGISATSVAAAPALLSLKTDDRPSEAECQQADKAVPGKIDARGLVYGRSSANDSSWLDIFRGDEVANAAAVDLSKVQQFLVSAMLIVTYAIAVGDWLHDHRTITTLPDFSEGFAALLGISHAGYLAYKAVPHGGATDASPGEAAGPQPTAADAQEVG